MSCQRCGGLLAAELEKAMGGLVCGMAVFENRHCHCDDDIEGPLQVKLQQEGEALSLGSRLQPSQWKGAHND
jgi:hypothetical protein